MQRQKDKLYTCCLHYNALFKRQKMFQSAADLKLKGRGGKRCQHVDFVDAMEGAFESSL